MYLGRHIQPRGFVTMSGIHVYGIYLGFLCFYLSGWTPGLGQEAIRYHLKEELPVGSVIGNVVNDASLDKKYTASVLNTLKFAFLSRNGPRAPYLAIDSEGGIRTAKRIDRDIMCPKMDTCYIKADVSVQSLPRQIFQIIKVDIKILDINDNWPAFPQDVMKIFIPESADRGIVSMIHAAEDADYGDYSIQHYNLISNSPKFKIQVDGLEKGEGIQLLLMDPLDREQKSSYQLRLVASDGGHPPKSGSVTLAITVGDVNDNVPKFENATYETTVIENAPRSTTILRVRARDNDAGNNGQIVYGFARSTVTQYDNIFGINNKTGEIYLKKALGYELGPLHKLSVVAKDRAQQPLTAGAEVTIKVVDINNHSPKITVNTMSNTGTVEISESSKVNDFVAHVVVSDLDGGKNGEFKCVLNHAFPHFKLQLIYKTDYKIVTSELLDRETKSQHTLTIFCRDKGDPPLSSREYVTVIVLDKNDHSPKFTQQIYYKDIRENNAVGLSIIHVNATDSDAGKNAKVQYSLIGGSDMFKINRTTGLVSAAVVFDREKIQDVEATVVAADQGTPPLSSTATILLKIKDVNDERPIFSQTSYAFGVLASKAVGTEVGKIFASDADAEPFNKYTFSLAEGEDSARTFVIDSNTGVIRTQKVLGQNNQSFFSVIAVATDNYNPNLNSRVNVSIWLADEEPPPPDPSSSFLLSGDNLVVILGLSGALAIMLIILAVVLIVYAGPRRRNRNRGGYISGNLVRVRRQEIDVIRKDPHDVKAGPETWITTWECKRRENENDTGNYSDQTATVPIRSPAPSDNYDSVEGFNVNSRCQVLTNGALLRSPSRRVRLGVNSPMYANKMNTVDRATRKSGRSHGPRRASSQDVRPMMVMGRESDSACSADVSNSESENDEGGFPTSRDKNIVTVDFDSLRRKARINPAGCSSSSESAMQGLDCKLAPGGEADMKPSQKNRIALVHPRTNTVTPSCSEGEHNIDRNLGGEHDGRRVQEPNSGHMHPGARQEISNHADDDFFCNTAINDHLTLPISEYVGGAENL